MISDIYANFSSVSEVYQQNKDNKTPADIGKKTLNVAISEFEKSLGIKLSRDELTFLSRHNFSQGIAEKIVQLIDNLYKNVIVVNSNLTANDFSDGIIIRDLKTQSENEKKDFSTILPFDKITDYLNKEELSILQGMNEDVRRNAVSLAIKLIKPNLTFNKNATEKKKQEILASVKPVFSLVKKNEMIVREGQKISEIDREKLESFYRKKGQASFSNLSTVLGIFLSVVLLGLVLYYWRTRNWPKKHDRSNVDSLFLSTAAVFQIFLVKAGIFLSDAINRAFPYLSVEACFYAIPFATAAMLVAVLTNRNMALVLSIFISFIISFLFENDVKMSLFCFLGSVASSYHVVTCRQRSAFFNAGLFLGLFNVAVIFCLGLIAKEIFSIELLIRLAMGMAGGLVSGILVAGLTPLFETIFKYTTDIKLLELANLNQPIFQRMMMEAPGTYHHSVVVASLVEAAAEAIGANPLLAKVSAYYHDIGKLKKPLYFIENQRNGENKHDKLSPKMSSLVIISHVKDGCEIAQQAKLGKEITNIIREHHGTGLVSFFYEKAKKDKDSSISSLPETDFRYPGPKPQTKEAGLVLLGDVLEASSRALSNPTPARITSLVRDRIEKIFTDGQLDECELTMRDLSKIAEIFTRILNGIFHHRIDYPEHANREMNLRKDSNGNIDQKPTEKSKA
ncbi:MAG: hypothetical protein A4E66_01628 [Syntrophus sp. PtaB.Bin001]|nr:MAG: hypothetical protein A4E66_01628 [Syntrophus sp. PtaB.Bin001]